MGLSQAETSRRLMMTEATVSRAMSALRQRGTILPVEYTRGPAPKLKETHFEWLRARVQASPFLSTYELTPLFREASPEVPVHRSTILRALHRLGLSATKKTGLASARFTDGLRAARPRFLLESTANNQRERRSLYRRDRLSSRDGATA